MAREGKALCHPNRKKKTEDGLCAPCAVAERRVTDLATRDQKRQLRADLAKLHETVEYVEQLGKQARAILEENAAEYAELHIEGARIAALDGNTKPAEWALTHLKMGKEKPIIEPAQRESEGDDSGVRVFIGVKVAGLAPGESVTVVDAPKP